MTDGHATTADAVDGAALLAAVVDQLGTGVAVCAAEDLTVLASNTAFERWLGGDGDLGARVEGLDADEVRRRTATGRTVEHEVEVRAGVRSCSLRLTVRRHAEREDVVVCEVHDVTGEKEAEYQLDAYARHVERDSRALRNEKERVRTLLLNVMPRAVANEMIEHGTVTPRRHDDATVLMLDFVHFTEMTVASDPVPLIAELNDIFTSFDRIVELFGCERLKTMGDAYVCVSGLPEPAVDHAANIARVALRFRRYLQQRNAEHTISWNARMGVHSGPVIGSIVGVRRYVYDVFGPGINLAARLERVAPPMTSAVSDTTAGLLRDDFVLRPLGDASLKGFGQQPVWSLESEVPRD